MNRGPKFRAARDRELWDRLVGEWRAERDTWRDRALKAEAERDDARAADHDHKLLADEWWRKWVAAEHCLAQLAERTACLNKVEGVLGARLVCVRAKGHTGEHSDITGAQWFPTDDDTTFVIHPDATTTEVPS